MSRFQKTMLAIILITNTVTAIASGVTFYAAHETFKAADRLVSTSSTSTATPAFHVGQEPFGLSQLTVAAWCRANNDKIQECLPKHFKQLDQNSVLYTATAGECDAWFEVGEHPAPPVLVAQLKYGNGFEGYPYWEISATPSSLVSGCVVLFSWTILMDQQGKITHPDIPAEYQPVH